MDEMMLIGHQKTVSGHFSGRDDNSGVHQGLNQKSILSENMLKRETFFLLL